MLWQRYPSHCCNALQFYSGTIFAYGCRKLSWLLPLLSIETLFFGVSESPGYILYTKVKGYPSQRSRRLEFEWPVHQITHRDTVHFLCVHGVPPQSHVFASTLTWDGRGKRRVSANDRGKRFPLNLCMVQQCQKLWPLASPKYIFTHIGYIPRSIYIYIYVYIQNHIQSFCHCWFKMWSLQHQHRMQARCIWNIRWVLLPASM